MVAGDYNEELLRLEGLAKAVRNRRTRSKSFHLSMGYSVRVERELVEQDNLLTCIVLTGTLKVILITKTF